MSEDVETPPAVASSASTEQGTVTPPATKTEPALHPEFRKLGPGTARYHHGASPAGWAGALTALVGVFVGAIGGTVPHWNPIIFAVGAILFVLGGVAAVVVRAIGFGNDG